MDVTKAPTTTALAGLGVGTAASSASASATSAAAVISTASNASTAVAAAADRVDIQPLDVAAALQILVAEVRAELPLPSVITPAGMALGVKLTEAALKANAPAVSQAAKLVAADLVGAERPEAVLTVSPSTADLALADVTAEPLVPVTEAPPQEPLPEAPDLAAILLVSAAPVVAEISSAGAGAAMGTGTPAPLPVGPLLRVGLPVIPTEYDLGPLQPLSLPPGLRLSGPAQASPALVRLFLQAVPDDAGDPAKWSATVTQLEVTLHSALDHAVAAVEQWRNVSQVVVDAARETRSLVMSQLNDEPPVPPWLGSEWMWLSRRLDRFRRRRRLAGRGLTDPDFWSLREDDVPQETPARRQDAP